jgi:hypothetical protein
MATTGKPGEDGNAQGNSDAGFNSGGDLAAPNFTKIKSAAVPESAMPASINWKGSPVQDIRVKLCVPEMYTSRTLGGGPQFGSTRPFENIGGPASHPGGIIFPFTPTISYSNTAAYTNLAPTHSNFNNYFFKNSHTTPISITGKFTCQNHFGSLLKRLSKSILAKITTGGWHIGHGFCNAD